MSSARVIQLRQILAEKFPGVRWHMEEAPAAAPLSWPTGLAQLDESLRGGLPRGALTEIISDAQHSGSAALIHAFLDQAAAQNQIVTLVDGADSFEATGPSRELLSRLLWVRCHSVEETLKAADLVLRDANLPLVLLDLKINHPKELRKIPSTVWYRFQRLVEETVATCVVFTPYAIVGSAQMRITVQSRFSLHTLDHDQSVALQQMRFQMSDARQFEPRQQTA